MSRADPMAHFSLDDSRLLVYDFKKPVDSQELMVCTAERIGMSASLLNQLRALVLFLFLLFVLPLFVLSAVIVASLTTGVPLFKFLRDPTAIMGAHPFAGIISNIGVLFWCATAAICLFGWSILRYRLTMARFATFLLFSGLFTILLMLDDFFQLHEQIFPYYFHVSERITYIGYGVLLFCLIAMFKDCILKTEYLILLIALCFFGLSLSIDMFQKNIEQFLGRWRILLEDGFKFFGIIGWFGYFLRCCFAAISNKSEMHGKS